MFKDVLKELRTQADMTQEELASKLGIAKSTVSMYENGNREPNFEQLEAIADIFNVDMNRLIGKKAPAKVKIESNISEVYTDHIHMIPVFESVSAGFGAYASGDILEYIPLYIDCPYEADNTICIKVSGDSMYPKIENGDIIQVYKQDSVDSGSIAVVLLDEEEGLVKKVMYGSDWIELHSINPMYPVQRFEGKDVTRLRVVGLVRKIIKECN